MGSRNWEGYEVDKHEWIKRIKINLIKIITINNSNINIQVDIKLDQVAFVYRIVISNIKLYSIDIINW